MSELLSWCHWVTSWDDDIVITLLHFSEKNTRLYIDWHSGWLLFQQLPYFTNCAYNKLLRLEQTRHKPWESLVQKPKDPAYQKVQQDMDVYQVAILYLDTILYFTSHCPSLCEQTDLGTNWGHKSTIKNFGDFFIFFYLKKIELMFWSTVIQVTTCDALQQ